jgi:hypothetical protein
MDGNNRTNTVDLNDGRIIGRREREGLMTERNPPSEPIERILETIDRNKPNTWDRYSMLFRFVLSGDGIVRVTSRRNDTGTYTVELSGGTASGCTCHSTDIGVGTIGCRHMRAVDAHPHL